jgi:spore coat protein CotH
MTPEQEERCVRIIRFVANASAEEFAAGIAQNFDLEETARFFACETLLSNYDGIYTTGQNFLMYLDPRTDRMGFIPWDLDHSWGEAQFIGNTYQREHSDIWQPWVGKNRFLERLFSAPPFRAAYRRELERLLATQFIPARMAQRIDALAPVIRPLLAEASTNRLKRFDIAVSSKFSDGPRETDHPDDPHRPVWQIKRFVENRAKNVRDQLDGKVKGVRVHHDAPKDTQRETPDKKKP